MWKSCWVATVDMKDACNHLALKGDTPITDQSPGLLYKLNGRRVWGEVTDYMDDPPVKGRTEAEYVQLWS